MTSSSKIKAAPSLIALSANQDFGRKLRPLRHQVQSVVCPLMPHCQRYPPALLAGGVRAAAFANHLQKMTARRIAHVFSSSRIKIAV